MQNCSHEGCEKPAEHIARLDMKPYCDEHAVEHGITPFFDVLKSIGGPAL